MRQKLGGVIGEMVITSNGVPANTFLKTKLFIGYQTLHWIPNCQHFCRHHFYSDNEHHIHLIHFGKCSYASSVKGKMKDCQVKGKKKKKTRKCFLQARTDTEQNNITRSQEAVLRLPPSSLARVIASLFYKYEMVEKIFHSKQAGTCILYSEP